MWVSRPSAFSDRCLELGVARRGAVVARLAPQLRPAAATSVDVLEPVVLAHRGIRRARGRLRLGRRSDDERRPARAPDRGLEVVEDDLAALAIEVDRAAGRQEREVRR